MSAWNITCTTRHPHQYTCQRLFVWHQSFIVKSSGQTSWQTQTNRNTHTQTNTQGENIITSLTRVIKMTTSFRYYASHPHPIDVSFLQKSHASKWRRVSIMASEITVWSSPDLNLTPLAAFLRFLLSAARQKREKAARGVRFKSGLRLVNNLFRLASKKTPKLYITGPLQGGSEHRSLVDSPHKGPAMRKALQCHNIIMENTANLKILRLYGTATIISW